jgi:hypothetical protein
MSGSGLHPGPLPLSTQRRVEHLLITRSHRLRDSLTAEIRTYDREHRPYDERD